MEQRLLLTGGAGNANEAGDFYYSLTSPAHLYNSDNSRLWADDSDIVKLTIADDGSWRHEIYIDGSDVGLSHWEEDIDAFAIRQDGSILVSTLGCVNVPGGTHAYGGDLLLFQPTSTGQHTTGTWELFLDGSDIGLSHYENIDAVAELTDGDLVISTQRNGSLPGIGAVHDEDLSRLHLTSTGSRTRGEWSRYFDGSDVSLKSSAENIDGVSIDADGSVAFLSTTGTAAVSGLYANDEDIFAFDASHFGSQTSGQYRSHLTLNASRAGISRSYDIDAFHAGVGDPANPQPPVIDTISDQTIDENQMLSLTPTATAPDTYSDLLEWSLVSGPSSANIDQSTGELSWTPLESDGPGTFEFTLAVSDGELTDTETFLVVVNEVNTAPVLTPIQDQTITAGATVSFDADATDSDLPANILTYSISGDVPSGANFDTSTGEFTWATLASSDAQSFDITVSVSDGELSDSESFSIIVNRTGLQVAPIDDQVVDELVPFSYQVVATGAASSLSNIDFEFAGETAFNAGDLVTDQFAAWGIHVTTDDPEHHPVMIFDSSHPTGGDYDLGTPNQKFGGPGIGHGGKSGRWRNDVARQNVLIISEDADSSDPDDNARGGTLIFDFDVPTDIDDIRLLDVDSGRNTIRLYDAAGQLISSTNIPRRGNNSVQLHALNAQGVSKMEVEFAGSGAITDLIFDRDGQGQTGGELSYALDDNAPAGMTINSTGLIDWIPTEAQGPGTYEVNVLVSDGTTTVTETFQITVAEVNVAPTIAPISDQVIDELVAFSYQVVATDSDLPANTLTYELDDSAPAGMSIDALGLITWTPTELQGVGSYPIGVLVSDGTETSRVDFRVVVREVNTAPQITPISNVEIDELEPFELQVEVTDVDLPANTLTFRLAQVAPEGISISDSGLIQWTPSEAQGEGIYAMTVVVSDGIEEATEEFSITVGEVNLAPVIQSIDNQTIDEQTLFELQVQATDSDLPMNALAYSLADGSPEGMTINGNGLISWTPSEQQGPNLYPTTVLVSDGIATTSESFELTVNEVNSAPILSEVGSQTTNEEVPFELQLSATDTDLPANDLVFSLIGTPPAGMTVDTDGLLAWTPNENQGPQDYTVTVRVSDGQLTDSKTFTITVNEVNVAPVISPIADQQHPELADFRYQVEASDSDLPASALSYELVSVVPAGMTIDADGLISWTPTEAQGPASYEVNVEVSDGVLTDVETFQISVTEQNLLPVLSPIDNQTVFPGNRVTVQATATDADLPANTLTFSIAGDVPVGATIDSANGLFNWEVPANADLGVRVVTITVDDQNGGLDAKTFSITVEGPAISTITLTEGDRFETTATQAITVPATDAYFEFDILNLSFDTDATGKISDAFEVALLDVDGNSLVHTIAADRDAFFNTSEPGDQAAATNTVVAGSVVRVDLSHLQAGTEATVVYRLVNNDNSEGDDTATTVTVTQGAVVAGNLNTPAGSLPVSGSVDVSEPVDLDNLIDVTSSLTFSYRQTSFNDRSDTLFADLLITNNSSQPIDGPFVLVVQNLTNPLVAVSEFDGATEDGDRYYLVGDLSATGTIEPGATTLAQTLRFFNPNDSAFDYNLTVLASPNAAPSFNSVPVTLVEAGRPYSYDSNAEDPDGDALVYELLAGPTGMTINATTGEITWSPETTDTGNQSVVIKASDGRGAFAEQQFTVEVRDVVPNRPPVIISSPVTQTSLAPDAEISTSSVLNFIELTPMDVSSSSTSAFTTLPSEDGTVFAPEFANAQSVNFDTDPFGNPIPSGSFITTQYESLGLVMNNFQVSSGVFGGPASSANATFTPAISGADLVFQFVVPVRAVGFINTSPDQDQIEFLDSEGAVIFSTRDQDDQAGPNFNVDRFLGAIADPSRPIAALRVLNNTGNLELDELLFVPIEATYQYQVEAIDPDFDPIRYQLDEAPSGMIVNATTGLISWAPGPDDVGTHTVKMTADDGRGGTATQEYQLVVLADPTNTAPVIVSDPVDDFFIPGFSNPASGDVTPQRISLDLGNGESFDGTVSITLPDQAGRFADIVISADESLSMGGDQDWIPDMIPLLDQALKDAGIGATAENPNRFAIVGGGRQNLVSYFFSQQPNTKYTLYGPKNEVVAEGVIDEVLPDELLNLEFEDDGRYVLVVEAENASDLAGGIDIGIEGEVGDGVRVEQLQLNTLVSDDFLLPGQSIEHQFALNADTLLYFDSQTKDVYSTITWSLDGPSGRLANNIRFLNSDVSDTTPTYEAVAGEYTLTIDASYDTASDYKFQLLDLSATTPIASGETVADEFETKVGTKAYQFSAAQGQLFAIDNSTTGVHSGSKWRLIDQTGNVLISKAIGTNQAPFKLPISGQYFLLMEAALWPGEGASQLRRPSIFEFTAEFVDPKPPTPVAFGDTVNGTIDFVADFVEYSFTLSDRTNFYLDSLVDNAMTWQLSGPAGTTTARRFDSSDSSNNADPVLSLVAGYYTMRVDSNGGEGPFAFRLLDLSDATSITPGTEFSGELTVPNETDFYKFSASAGEEFFLDVVTASNAGSSLYRIYDQYGREINETRPLSDSTSLVIPVDGEYTLLVEGYRANTNQDTYTFNVVPIAQTTHALTLGALTSGSITTAGERITHTFSLGGDTQLYFDSLTNDSNIVWSLDGPRGEEVSSQRIDRSDSTDRVDATIDALAGAWQLTIQATGDATGDFSFALLDLLNPTHVTQITPNPGAGNPTVTITPTAGLEPLQTEIFRFTADAGDEFSFITNVTGSIGSYYRIVDSNGTEVTPRTILTTDRRNQVMSRSGDYLLLVEPRFNNTDVDDYSIDINFVQNNGPTSFAGTPLILGATISGDLSTAGQVDAYTFTLSDRSVTYFDSLTNSSTVRWNLTGPTGVIVSNRAFSASDSFNLSDVTADLLPGNYLLEVFASSGATGTYSFRAYDVATATPITPGTSFYGELAELSANETDLYKFDAVAGETFYFNVEAATDVTNTQYKLIDPFGRRVFTSNRLNDFGPQELDFDGTYTLLVEAERSNTGPDTYTMNVLQVPAAVPVSLTFGDTATGSLSTPGEISVFTFSVDEFIRVHFDSQTNSGIYNWTLQNEAETVVSARRFNASDSFNVTQSVIELIPGDYRLTIAGNDDTQDFAFRLLDVADATAIDVDTPVTSVHPINRSTNTFTFDALAGDTFFFDSQNVDGLATSASWRLFDDFGNELFERGVSADSGPLTLDRAGTYRILVEGRISDAGTDGESTFEVVLLGNTLNPTPPVTLTLGDVVDGEIDKKFQSDRYAFTLTEDTLGYFDSLNNDSSLNWTLTNQFGTVVSPRAFNSSTSSLLRLPAGDYVLTVTSIEIEPYSFAFYDLSTSPVVVPGTSQTGELATANETDIYQFSGVAGEQIYIDVLNVSSAGRANFRVVDELGRELTSSTSVIDQDTFALPADGQYFAIVEGKINQTVATTYEFNVVRTNTVNAALSLGAPQSVSLDTIGQTIEYSFNLPGDASLYLDSLTDTGLIQWSLEGAAGNVVTNRRFDRSDSFDFETPLLKSLAVGDYTLTVTGIGDAVGSFSFRLVDVASGVMVTPGTPVSGELTIPNETDIYRFDGTVGDQLLVDWLAADDTNNSLYRVYDPFGNEMFEFRDLLDSDLPALPFTGTYTLLVEGWGANTGLDAYEFNLVPSANRGVAINIGDTVDDTLAIGESVDFTFDVGSDIFAHFDSLTNQLRLTWSLTGPTGEIITNRGFHDSDSFDETNSVFELRQGTYKLTVDGATDFAGDFGFSLLDVATAAEITPGTITGTLDPGTETQLYKFAANAGDSFSFDSLSTTNGNAVYRVVDPFGRTIFTRVLNGDQNDVDMNVTGTYTLLVEGRVSAVVPNTYELNVIFNGNTAPNTLVGGAITLGATQTGDLNTAAQIDSYQFTLADRSLLHMDVLTNIATFRWSLRGPRGIEVANRSFNATDSLDSPTSNLDLAAGDYQLDIFASSGTPGAYAFTLHDFADAIAITPGTEFAGELTNPTETDLYQFTANAGERFLIDVVANSDDANNKEFKLIDQYGIVLATSTALRDVDQIMIPNYGTYTLLVEGRRNNTGTDTYSISVVPIVTATFALTPGVASVGNIQAGHKNEYTFSLTEPSLLLFTSQTDSNLVEWTLANDVGTPLVDARDFDDGILPIDLLAGDYTLTVDGVNDYVGEANFTAVIAESSSQLEFGDISNTQLTASNSVAVYQFNGVAGQHFALRPDFNLVFDDAATSALTADDLSTSYDNEDQHSGIDVALRNDMFRDGAAINFITVSDEDRDILDDNVNFETIFTDLSQRDALLNAIVSSQFRDENNTRAIGVDKEGNAYLADGVGGFTVSPGGIATTGNISIKQDYIDLAWALDGAAWDLGQLRVGGVTAESFTNAFVDVKVAEILEQTSLRLSSSDPNADLNFVDPSTGVYNNIVGGQQYDFDIQIDNDGNPRSFDLLFKQGQTIGSIPVYIVAPYGYNAMAVDADGDTLTWSITEGPDGLVVDPATGILAWPADSVVYGQHAVTLRVEDGRGGFNEQTFELNVNGGEAASISGSVSQLDRITPVDIGLLNGSFEFPVAPIGGGLNLTGSELPGWTVETTGPHVSVVNETFSEGQITFQGQEGNQWLDLEGFGTQTRNGISQNVNTIPGRDYVLSFHVGSTFLAGRYAASTVELTIDDGSPIIFTNSTTPTDQLDWQKFEYRFTATHAETKISFYNGSEDGNLLSGLDSVQLFGTVPGPAANVTVYLDQNRNRIFDQSELSTQTDSNGDYSFEVLPSGSYTVALLPEPGWNLTFPATTNYEVSLDPGMDVENIQFARESVSIVNTDPRITSSPVLNLVGGETFEYSPTLEELDGDKLTFDLPLSPAGMAVNPESGRIVWDTTLDNIGTNNVLLRVKDERDGFDLQYFTITVAQPNTAPVISSTAPVGPAGINLPYRYNADAIDADGDTFAWLLNVAPEGATIDATTGVINWTPNSEQLGSQEFVVNVNDGRGLSDQQTFSVNVEVDPVNADPEILSSPPVEAYLANQYLYRVQVTDVNGDPLTFTLDTAPVGMAVDADGLVSWTPTPAQVGSSVVRIVVEDGRGGSAVQEYSLLVNTQPVNQAPQITSIPKTTAVAGQAYNFQPTAVDANNDTLVWELVSGPVGMSINPSSGTLNWLPTIGDLGSEQVVIRVFDTSAAFSELGYTLNVRSVNTPPVIQSVPVTSASVGATFLHQVQATDVDGDQLSFALVAAPAGMAIDSVTGLIVWTPVAGQEGSNAVDVRVSDGNGGFATQSFLIETAAGISNLNPTITSAPSFIAGVGDLYSYDVEATDPEGATLTYQLLQSPTGMTIDGSTGVIQWTPTAGDLGTTIVRLVARDPAGAGSLQEFALTVLAANNAPVINSTPPTIIAAGATYRYDVLATDADGEFLTYELVNAPAGMLIDGVGRIFWIPTSTETGSNPVEVKVTDPRGGSVTQAFDINVEVDTVDPQVAVLLSQNPVNIGDSVDIRVSAIDNVGVESLTLTVGGVAVALDANGIARLPMNTIGGITAVATATDAAGNTAMDSITIFVTDPNDVEGPVLGITSPSDGGIITGLTDIIGTVTDDTLVEYRLLVAEFGSSDFQQIATGDTNITNDVLGQLDPTLLVNGSYILRLEAIDAGGRSNVTQQLVEISGSNKLGNFRVSFTDLVVPVNGIDVVLNRTYDSLTSAQNSDFGFGWRMDFRDVQLQVSVDEASDFDKAYGFYTPYRIGTRVYITLPGGERQGFTFNPAIRQLPSIFGPGLVLATPRFIPDAGVTNRLTVQSGQLLLNEFGETTVSGGLPWNPASPDYGGGFTLTTKEGIAYRIDGNSGKVNRISDPNGNQLNFSDAGVKSNSGISISFERDSNGRIVAVIDPDGNRIEYAYSASGDLSSVTDRTGNTTSYKYESSQAHFLTDIVDPLGNTGIRGEYDDEGRLVSMKDADGNDISITTNLGDNSQLIVDALGNQTIFQYDSRGNTTAVTNALGNTTASTYDTNNNLTSETDPLGNTASYTYDSQGNVTSTTDPLGHQRTFSYGVNGVPLSRVDEIGAVTLNTLDSKGNVLSTKNPLGHVTSYTYDSRGNQLTETNALGYVTQFAYDTTGNLVTQTDAAGHATSFTYDARGNRLSESISVTTAAGVVIATTAWTYDSSDREISRTDALENTSRTEYNALGLESAMIDENGNRTEFDYDARRQLLSTLFADGTSASNTYDANGRQLSSVDQLGRVTHFEHDAVGNLITTIYPDATPVDLSDNPRTTREYDSANRVVAQIDELGNRRESRYDEAGRIIAVILPDGTPEDPTDNLRTEYVYDARYFLTATTNPARGLTLYSHDLVGNLVATQFADGTSTRQVFDSLGRRVTSIDQNGVATSYEYDELDRLTAVVQPLDVPVETVLRTVYGYDERGNFTTQTDANGNTTQYQYDLLSRRIGTTLPPGQQSTTDYDAVGNVVSETNFNGQEITFTYDTMNRLTSRDLPDGSSFDFTYTQTGQRDTIVDGRGTTTYVYDERDRVLSRSEPDGVTISYGYDLAGNEISQTTPAGTVAKTYDELRRLTTVTDPQGGVTTYQFDGRGRLAETQYPNGTSDILTLDNLSRILRIETQGPSGLIRSMDYTLDATGRRTSITEESGRTVVYEYDSLYRLMAERITDPTFGNHTIEYTYDSVGNRLTRADSENGTTTYFYDSNDRLLAETTAGVTTTYTYDANGNTLTKFVDTNNQTTYRWNAENRLISATIVADSVTTEMSYRYDADGLRVEVTIDGETVRSLLDKNREFAEVVVEYLPDGEIQAAYTRGYELISAIRGNEQAFYHADAIGTIRIMTGADGNVVNSYVYDAFGRVLEQNATFQNSFLYAGELRDSGLGLDFLRSRYYSAPVGRFSSRDSFAGLQSLPLSLHKYTYTHNDPVNGTDPSGELSSLETLYVAGIAVGLGAGFFAGAVTVKSVVPLGQDGERDLVADGLYVLTLTSAGGLLGFAAVFVTGVVPWTIPATAVEGATLLELLGITGGAAGGETLTVTLLDVLLIALFP